MKDTIRAYEELAYNAFPAFENLLRDGWLIQASGGYGNRANSVLPLYPGILSLDGKIAEAEEFYRSRGLQPTFKMTEAATPSDLDSVLEARGYERIRDTSIQTLSIHDREFSDSGCNIAFFSWQEHRAFWQELFTSFNGMNPHDLECYTRILNQSAARVCGAVLYQDDQPAAFGLGVSQNGSLGIFNVMTHPERRRQGLGSAVMGALLKKGQKEGAKESYLQVMLSNPGALKLYYKLGYREQYQYWYRKQPQS